MMRRLMLMSLCLMFLMSTTAQADSFHVMLVPKLQSHLRLQQPFDRWAQEFTALLQPELHFVAEANRQSLMIDMWMGNAYAFSMELLQHQGQVALQSSLVADDWLILDDHAAQDARALLDWAQKYLRPDIDWHLADATLHVLSGDAVSKLHTVESFVAGWADIALDPAKDHAIAVARAISFLREHIQSLPPKQPLLSVFLDYQPPYLVPAAFNPDWAKAPPDLLAQLLSKIPYALLKATAEASTA